jgi:hypothetical protein
MTVELEFKPDERALRDAMPDDDVSLFGWTLLIVPIAFLIDGRDMLGVVPTDDGVWTVDPTGGAQRAKRPAQPAWQEQPLLGFLIGVERAVEETRDTGSSSQQLALGAGELGFRLRSDGRMEILPVSGDPASAEVDDVIAALRDFRARVRGWIESSGAHLLSHPSWSEWFPLAEG